MKRILYAILILLGHTQLLWSDYTITNQTNYPAKASVTLICQYQDGQYKEHTIELDYRPKESKNFPQSCRLMSLSALLNANGTNYSTGVFDAGSFYGGQASGMLPSWEISDAVEGQYSGYKPFIRMAP